MDVADSVFLAALVARLHAVPGLVALVLGGSRASGTHTPQSDYDIGIYYDRASFNIPKLRAVAAELDDQHRPDVVTALGGWGAWVDGGGWLTVQGQAVDLIYRDTSRVVAVVSDMGEGQFTSHYHWGHPHAFISATYAAEVALCRILSDPENRIADLKANLTPYPEPLRRSLITAYYPEAEFCAFVARHGLPRQDCNYIAGCLFRAVTCLAQAICALNCQWVMNEKGIVALAARQPYTLPDFAARVDALYAPLARADGCADAVGQLDALLSEGRRVLSPLLDA